MRLLRHFFKRNTQWKSPFGFHHGVRAARDHLFTLEFGTFQGTTPDEATASFVGFLGQMKAFLQFVPKDLAHGLDDELECIDFVVMQNDAVGWLAPRFVLDDRFRGGDDRIFAAHGSSNIAEE